MEISNITHVKGCLRPDRVINIGQVYQGNVVGGVSFQVQVPLPQGTCFEELPPTGTMVTPTGREPGHLCLDDAGALIKCLELGSREVCAVDIRSVIVEVRFRRDPCCD